jgi:hypothetical protein
MDNQISSNKHKNTTICLSVDGSEHSEIAFNLIAHEYMPKDDVKLMIIYIYKNDTDDNNNFNNLKDTVIQEYDTKILKFPEERSCFIKENRSEKSKHSLEQVSNIVTKYHGDFLFCGYYGIKGPKGDNKELTKGVNYLLGHSSVPTVIIKENSLDNKKVNKGFKWCFIFDASYMNYLVAMEKFLPLVDKENDIIFGYGLYLSGNNKEDHIKKDFNSVMSEAEITNYSYQLVEYHKSSFDAIVEIINFGEISFDFLVFRHHPERYLEGDIKTEVTNVVTKSSCNICFYNY